MDWAVSSGQRVRLLFDDRSSNLKMDWAVSSGQRVRLLFDDRSSNRAQVFGFSMIYCMQRAK